MKYAGILLKLLQVIFIALNACKDERADLNIYASIGHLVQTVFIVGIPGHTHTGPITLLGLLKYM